MPSNHGRQRAIYIVVGILAVFAMVGIGIVLAIFGIAAFYIDTINDAAESVQVSSPQRTPELIYDKADLKQLLREWEREWNVDERSWWDKFWNGEDQSPFRTHGGII